MEFDTPAPIRPNFSAHRRESHPHEHPIIQLPPFGIAKRFYATQYAYLGTIFSFSNPQTFEENLQEIYDRPPDFTDKNDCLIYCQVLLILAFGKMYSVNQWTSHDGPPGFEYFQQAMQLLPDIHEQGSVTFIEVLSLVGYFLQNLNRRDAAFLYVSIQENLVRKMLIICV